MGGVRNSQMGLSRYIYIYIYIYKFSVVEFSVHLIFQKHLFLFFLNKYCSQASFENVLKRS